jgi:hypothetical protein
MNRRHFLASILALPAAAKAFVATPMPAFHGNVVDAKTVENGVSIKSGLPRSLAGLIAGSLYVEDGILKVVP